MRLKMPGDGPSGTGGLAEHGFAGGEEVLEGFFEVAGVPGVGDVAADAGVGHHEVDFAVRIGGDDSADEPQVGGIHADDAVETGIIGTGNLAGSLPGIEPHPVLAQAPLCRRIDGIADLLRRHGCRLDVIQVLQPLSPHHRLQYELRHRAPANIPMAYEQYPHSIVHQLVLLCGF